MLFFCEVKIRTPKIRRFCGTLVTIFGGQSRIIRALARAQCVNYLDRNANVRTFRTVRVRIPEPEGRI